ncbi:hypothetical protein X943_003051 [Babesia divergens]|uniref:Peptidase C1A papain C-terminal domain-containing protein n=1 Tax=Babesia divergens TaxID=32595 RepID=A0AAD9GG04_BABDI|nr:hypothetical protein X943_003051 [Babesia divergens]
MALLLFFLWRYSGVSGNVKESLSIRKNTEYLRHFAYFNNVALSSTYQQIKEEVLSRGLTVVPGTFDACKEKGWKLNCVDSEQHVRGVLDWEIVEIANLNTIMNVPMNAKDEVDTILAHKKFNDANGIQYKNQTEYSLRYHNFRLRKQKIDEHNGNPKANYTKGYSWAMEFSDSTAGTEMIKRATSQKMYHYVDGNFVDVSTYMKTHNDEADDIILMDWRKKNVITPVINQGGCGSCWAIAAASLIDAYRAIKTGSLVQHSPQHLLDCTAANYNCESGGNHESALKYAENEGICENLSYPYSAKKESCKASSCVEKFKVDGITKLDQATLEQHIANHGPALVAVILTRDFMEYSSGIFDGLCESKRLHSVLIVGYGVNKRTNHKFWIVKNSWGPNWGYGGFYKLSREPQGIFTRPDSFCGVNNHAFGLKIQ